MLADIAEYSGNFIAAQAGSQLESYLSGKGAGADKFSEQSGMVTANIDIGGGTTNISYLKTAIAWMIAALISAAGLCALIKAEKQR